MRRQRGVSSGEQQDEANQTRMPTREQRTIDDESVDPEDLLPEHSVLKLEEYLAMQDAIGNETRFRILYALKTQGEMSANQLKELLGMRPNNLHYHLDKLCDVGLVQNRKRKTPDSDGLYSYYVASGMGKAILEHEVEELIRREHEFKERYSS
jgi:ArsR family transcriptional regulator